MFCANIFVILEPFLIIKSHGMEGENTNGKYTRGRKNLVKKAGKVASKLRMSCHMKKVNQADVMI